MVRGSGYELYKRLMMRVLDVELKKLAFGASRNRKIHMDLG